MRHVETVIDPNQMPPRDECGIVCLCSKGSAAIMLTTILGIVVIVLGLICWLGQALVVFAPRVAIKLGLNEREEDLDRSM